MAHIYVKHSIDDYDEWKDIFDNQHLTRKAAGCTDVQIFRNASDQHEVVLIYEWDEVNNAYSFVHSSTFSDFNKNAGAETTEITFLVKEL
ncbi:antibiotic biosynthesis monooxygenase [candidate division KSB1 bacterium]